ncbi:MAG: DNA repair exonuclease [Candidatus Aenigmatarchaeota archaeon]|nr:DNA repair exonuclease [Candidatus Aenigmarchaeota archaeon]
MKISVFSDLHFGVNANTKLENDCFENAEEAIDKSLDSDIIIICGDIFDSRYPRPDTIAKATKILSKPLFKHSEIKIVSTIGKKIEKIHERILNGIPIIAIHGTHDRLTKDQINAVQLLDTAGILFHLHLNGIVLEKDGVKIAIQGMSGVPERYAGQILEEWSPKPIEGCYNILLLHQSIDPFIYSPQEPPTISIDSLPEGFDLIINGHIHKSTLEIFQTKKILLPGSIIVTQFKKEEQDAKGIWKIEIPKEKIYFEKLLNTRKFFYEEIHIDKNKSIKSQIKEILQKFVDDQKPPVVRLKIYGSSLSTLDKEIKSIEDEYKDKIILKYSKHESNEQVKRKTDYLRKAREGSLSIDEMGIKILVDNLNDLNFDNKIDSAKLFEELSSGNIEEAEILLKGENSD